MRNMVQYPVTLAEIVQCLDDLRSDLSYEKTGLVGDMRPTLLEHASRIVMRSGFVVSDVMSDRTLLRTSMRRRKEKTSNG